MANTTTGAAATTTFPANFFPGGGVSSNSTFTLIGPPPPFPAPPRSVDLSPLKFILAVLAVVAVPALAYALFFTVLCPSGRRRGRRSGFSSDDLPTSIPEAAPPPSTTGGGGAGADAGVIAGDVKFKKDSRSKEIGNECSVCLLELADGEEVRQLSACKHAFHASCIETWLTNRSSCPICRAAVPVKRPDGNGNGNRNGGNRRVSATNRDDEWHQGLPDASSLV